MIDLCLATNPISISRIAPYPFYCIDMKQRRPITPEVALIKLETLCARLEHSTGELIQKLRNWGISSSDSEEIIKSLTRDKFVDDRRFASAFARDRLLYSGYGRRRIAMALAQKKVSADIIKEVLVEVLDPEEYFSRLQQIIETKALKMEEVDSWESRNKLYRWAVGRGFESDIVVSALKKVLLRLKSSD